jgi:hypothetical protein
MTFGAFDVPLRLEWEPVSFGMPTMTILESSKLFVFAQQIFSFFNLTYVVQHRVRIFPQVLPDKNSCS